VIGLPGDKVEIDGGYVVVNGKRLQEKYIANRYRDDDNYGLITVPPNDYFVLGDHRNASNDSRAWGFVPKSYIYGKAVFVFWPLKDLGTVR
jgi:signal peptidase I